MLNSKIRKLRTQKGLTTQQAIEGLNISYSMLNKIERGDRSPGKNLIIAMSNLYDCTIEDIFEAIN
jgi:transcriptional regulator with XRE-family HTH domain